MGALIPRISILWAVAVALTACGVAAAQSPPPPAPLPQVAPATARQRQTAPAPTVQHRTTVSTAVHRSTVAVKPVSAAQAGSMLLGAIAIQRKLIIDAKRDVELAQKCRTYGSAHGWHCFGVDPHRLKGSIAQVLSRNIKPRSPASRSAWKYILDVRRKHLYINTLRRLDALIDQAMSPTRGYNAESTALRKQKGLMERLGDLGKVSYMDAFFDPSGLTRLQNIATAVAAQRPPVLDALNRYVSTFNRSCKGKSRPKWPTICWMADEHPSPFQDFKVKKLRDLPIKVGRGQNDRQAANTFVQKVLPVQETQLITRWQHKNVGSMKSNDKRTREFVTTHYTDHPIKEEIKICAGVAKSFKKKSAGKECLQNIVPRGRGQMAWLHTAKVRSEPACVHSGTMNPYRCASLQTKAYWKGYDSYQPPQKRRNNLGQLENAAGNMWLALLLLGGAAWLLRIKVRRRRNSKHSQHLYPRQPPLG